MPDDALAEVVSLSGGGDMTCAHRRDSTTWCWGDDALTGDSLVRAYAAPANVEGITTTAKRTQVCVILGDHTVSCSSADFGLSGSSTPGQGRGLVPMPNLANVAQLALGTYMDCIRRLDGSVACWGDYAEVLQTGTYDSARRSGARRPRAHELAEIHGIPKIADIAGGQNAALAVGEDGSVWTLGGLARGVLRISGIDDAVQAASGGDFQCVRRRSGSVACWRDGFATGSLATLPNVPQMVENISDATDLAAGAYGACAVLRDGRASCWGAFVGLTDSDAPNWLTARPIPDAHQVRAIMVGDMHGCGLRHDGRVFCWGLVARIGSGMSHEVRKYGPTKVPRGSGYVRTRTADDPVADGRRASLVVVALTLAGLVVAALYARRVERRMGTAWRRIGVAPLAIGSGYRATEIQSNRSQAPTLLRVAAHVGLLSVGADTVFLVLLSKYSLVAGSLALRQIERAPLSACLNFATALLSIVAFGWLFLVAKTLVASACASKQALQRLRIIGMFGVLGHGLLGLSGLASRYPIRWFLSGGFDASEAADLVWILVLAAAMLGVVAAVLSAWASRHRHELP
jgi:alpha-tubulin suppressor-like RCC1 family protein